MAAPLTGQLSVRLSDEQRSYIKEQQLKLQKDPQLQGFKWSEGDIVRALIEHCRRVDYAVAPLGSTDEGARA